MAMNAGRHHQAGQAVEQLEGGEAKFLATVPIGLGEPVDQTSFRRRERLETGRGVEPLQSERPPRTVASEPLETRAVLRLDPDGAVDREAAGAPPRAHVHRRGGVQEPAPCEPAQDAQLHRTGQGFRVRGLECGGFVEAYPALDVVGDHAIEGQHVVVLVLRKYRDHSDGVLLVLVKADP